MKFEITDIKSGLIVHKIIDGEIRNFLVAKEILSDYYLIWIERGFITLKGSAESILFALNDSKMEIGYKSNDKFSV